MDESYAQFRPEAEWIKRMALAMKPLTEDEIKLISIKNAPMMVNAHLGTYKIVDEDIYKPIGPIGPDQEIDCLGDAYLLHARNRHKPMTFSQFYEINRVDEARVRSWIRMDKVLALGIKLKIF
jgi:hypothetical protein